MTCTRTMSLVKVSLLVLCAVALSLSASRPASAKFRTAAAAREDATSHISSNNAVNAHAAKRILLRIIRGKAKANPKFAKTVLTACSCATAAEELDAEGFWGRFTDCLQRWGVSYSSLTTCGAVCAVAATGNPIGIAVCAGCLGTAEWIVAGCAMKAVYSRNIVGFEEGRVRFPQRHGRNQARLSGTVTTEG